MQPLNPPTTHLEPEGGIQPTASGFLWRSGPLQVPDLLYQVVFLVAELLVLGPVRLEVAQELHELGLVLQQDVQHGLSLVGVGDKDLKDMECFKLDVPAVVSEHVHHQLQVFCSADVLGHYCEVVSVEEQFPEQLQRLPLGDVVVRMQELFILCKHPVIIALQEICTHYLVP